MRKSPNAGKTHSAILAKYADDVTVRPYLGQGAIGASFDGEISVEIEIGNASFRVPIDPLVREHHRGYHA